MFSESPVRPLLTAFAAIAICVASTFSLHADIQISLDPNGGTNVDTGVAGAGQIISFFIGQDANSSDALFGLAADFDFSAGVMTGGTVGATGSGAPAGFFGAGNLSASNFSFIPSSANVD